MKIVNALFSTITFILLLAVTGFAQDKQHRAHDRENLVEALDLKEQQLSEMKLLKESARAETEKIKMDESLDRLDKKVALLEIRMKKKEQFNKILTADQLIALEELKLARMEKANNRIADHKKRFENVDIKALKSEVKAYKEENIEPVVRQKRLKLEDEIDEADKQLIADLRFEFQAFKEMLDATKEEFKSSAEGQKPSPDLRLDMLKKIQSSERPDFDLARALVDKYEAEISKLFEELIPRKEIWKQEIKAIKNKYISEEMVEERDRSEKKSHQTRRHNDRPGNAKAPNKMHPKLKFLLMDVSKEKTCFEKGIKSILKDISVYPNPAFNENKINYSVAEDGEILIELYNNSGKLVKTVSKGYKKAGTYSETVDLKELNGQLYYYILTEKNGTSTKKFIKIADR